MKNHILLFFTVLLFHAASAQDISVTADKKNILIGEQIKLELQASFKKGQEVNWFAIDTLSRFEILERSKIDTQQNDASITLSQTLTITSWDSGSWKVPPLLLGKTKTSPIDIEVSFTEMNPDKEYNDIKDIILVKKPVESKWHWYLIFAVILVGLFLLFFPKAKKKEPGVFVADEGAYKIALKKLNKLEAQQVSDPKLFYTELVYIFREYLHRKKNIQSFSKTTEDLALQLKKINLPAEQYDRLVTSLQLSDMVKFARFQPQARENETAFETIKESIIIIETLPHAV